MDLNHIYNLCTQLQSISGTKTKQQFLIDNRCDDFDFFLKFLLNPQIVVGIDKKKLKKKVPLNISVGIEDLREALCYLMENNTGRNIDIGTCQYYIHANHDYADFLTAVFTKSLKLGVDVKLVNKAYGNGFIPVHEVQLGSGRDKLRLKDGEWFSLSQKLNGIRATYVQGKMISRQGKEIKGLEGMCHLLGMASRQAGIDFVFDGELVHKNNGTMSDNENFRLTTSLVNSEDADKFELEFVVFDCLPYDEFVNGASTKKYKERKKILNILIQPMEERYKNGTQITCIRTVPVFYQGTDQSEIDKQLAIADELGYEGLMLNKDAVYECKRVTSLIKIKSFKFSDLRIIGYEEGAGKYKGMLGAVIVDYKGNSVNVGSGFDEAERVELWKNPDELLGKIATIKYKEVSKNKDTGLESLQFPVMICIREDKTEPSYE